MAFCALCFADDFFSFSRPITCTHQGISLTLCHTSTEMAAIYLFDFMQYWRHKLYCKFRSFEKSCANSPISSLASFNQADWIEFTTRAHPSSSNYYLSFEFVFWIASQSPGAFSLLLLYNEIIRWNFLFEFLFSSECCILAGFRETSGRVLRERGKSHMYPTPAQS